MRKEIFKLIKIAIVSFVFTGTAYVFDVHVGIENPVFYYTIGIFCGFIAMLIVKGDL